MLVTLFFGGWRGPFIPAPGTHELLRVLVGLFWFGLKTGIFLAIFVLLRATLPRPRFDQLMSLGWKTMLPLSLANLLVTGIIVIARSHP
jgi:NADH-quinone oxidoreductase subunit H